MILASLRSLAFISALVRPLNSVLNEGSSRHGHEAGPQATGGRSGAAPVHLGVVAQVGFGGEALVALRTGKGLLFGVHAAVTDELRGHSEGLPAVRTLVAFGLGVDAPVVLQRHQVRELFLTRATVKRPGFVAVLVVQEGASVSIGASALIAHVRFVSVVVSRSVDPVRVQALLLHQGPVQTAGPAHATRRGPRGRGLSVRDLQV